MDSIVTAALIGAGTQAAGNWFANQQQQASAREQMEFQERMSRNRYRYAVADLKAAGLNPALAYGSLGGSTPVGAQANIRNVMEGVGDNLSKSVERLTSTSIAKKKMDAEIELLNSATDKNYREADRAFQQYDNLYKEGVMLDWKNKIAPDVYQAEKRQMEIDRKKRDISKSDAMVIIDSILERVGLKKGPIRSK